MFCPDGFETLASTYRMVGDIALQWSRKQPRIEGRKLTQDMSEPEATRWEAYREWLWGRFVKRTAGQLFVTSPEGNALKLDIYAGNFWVNPEEKFPDDPIEQRILAKKNLDVFYAIRPETFTVDVHHSPPDSDRPDLNNLLQTWHGWPVCWKPLANQGLEALLFDTPVARKNGNRPPKQEPIRKRFQELYPNGRGKTHWVTVTCLRRRRAGAGPFHHGVGHGKWYGYCDGHFGEYV